MTTTTRRCECGHLHRWGARVPEDDHETEARLEAFDLMREALRDLLPVATSDFDLANLTLTEITKRVAKACAALAAADKAARG